MSTGVDSIAGLPLHTLIIHAVVVLVPLAGLGAVLMAIWPAFSRRYGVLTVGLASVGAIGAVIAKESGERLAQQIGSPGQHADLGGVLPLFALGFLGVLLAFWLADRGIPANRSRPSWLKVLGAVLIASAVVVTVLTVWTGHTGAAATWGGVVVGD